MPGESEETFHARLRTEVITPSERLQQRIKTSIKSFAYPYGDTNETVIDLLRNRNIELGFTVNPGSVAAFSQPYRLQRTMIFGDFSLLDFAQSLVVFEETGR